MPEPVKDIFRADLYFTKLKIKSRGNNTKLQLIMKDLFGLVVKKEYKCSLVLNNMQNFPFKITHLVVNFPFAVRKFGYCITCFNCSSDLL